MDGTDTGYKGSKFAIAFAGEKSGACPAHEFFDGLSLIDKAKLMALFQIAADHGKFQNSEKFGDRRWALRVQVVPDSHAICVCEKRAWTDSGHAWFYEEEGQDSEGRDYASLAHLQRRSGADPDQAHDHKESDAMKKTQHEVLMEDPEFRRLLSVESLAAEASEVIARLMAEQNLSKADLARRLNKSRAWVTQLLSGKANMTVRTLAEVAHTLGAQVKLHAQSRAANTRNPAYAPKAARRRVEG